MNSSEALETLRRSEPDLRARGVRRAAVFGSVARGDSRPDSDIDIMVEIDPDAHLTVFDYVGLKDYIASLFDGPVDVVNRDGLSPISVPPRPLTRSMPSKPVVTALRDILHHIDLAVNFSAGFDRASFKLDIKTVYAVTRCLEIISEASRRLPDDMKARHPTAPRCP